MILTISSSSSSQRPMLTPQFRVPFDVNEASYTPVEDNRTFQILAMINEEQFCKDGRNAMIRRLLVILVVA